MPLRSATTEFAAGPPDIEQRRSPGDMVEMLMPCCPHCHRPDEQAGARRRCEEIALDQLVTMAVDGSEAHLTVFEVSVADEADLELAAADRGEASRARVSFGE